MITESVGHIIFSESYLIAEMHSVTLINPLYVEIVEIPVVSGSRLSPGIPD
jgi:hypothetical protein